MFRLFRPHFENRYADGGLVACPLRGHDIEVDLCAGCESADAMDLEADPPFVCCSQGSVHPLQQRP